MKNYFLIFLSLFFSTLLLSQSIPTSGAYTEDETDFFVAGNKVNEALERVNLLLCYLENTRPATFVNKGSYVATIFEEDCVFGQARAGDQQKATSSSGGQSAKDSSSSSGGDSGDGKKKKGNQTFLTVTQQDDDSDMIGKIWVQLPKDERYNTVAADGALANGPEADYGLPFDATVYLKHSQSTPPSAENKLGNFTMNYSVYTDAQSAALDFGAGPITGVTAVDLTQANTKQEKIDSMNFSLGNGFVSSNNNTIKFKESMGDGLEELSITYDGTTASGVFTHQIWDGVWAADNVNNPSSEGELLIYYAFIIDEANDWYCEKPIKIKSINYASLQTFYDFDPSDDAALGAAEGQAASTVDVDVNNTGLTPTETCYSLSRDDAYKNVWSYGVYNEDGTRAGGNAGAFPIRAESGSENIEDYYGWADYWGTWVDTWGRPSFDPESLTWQRDDGRDSGFCSGSGCTMSKSYASVNKFATSYKPLNSINKLKLSLDVGWSYEWRTEWGSLLGWNNAQVIVDGKITGGNGGTCSSDNGPPNDFENENNHVCFWSMEGYWDKDLDGGNGAFVITHGMKWSYNGDPRIELATPITITSTQYTAAMEKASGERLDLWTWSPDTFQSFQIPWGAVDEPTSIAAGSSIKRETFSRISMSTLISDLGDNGTLSCLSNCLDPAKLNTVYTNAALAKVTDDPGDDTAFTNTTATIYDDDAKEFFTDPQTSFWSQEEGVASSLVAIYRPDSTTAASATSLHLADSIGDVSANNEITLSTTTQDAFAAVVQKFKEPVENFFWDLRAAGNGYNAPNNTWDETYIGWAARSGYLVPTSNIAQLECDKDQGTGEYYNENHPRYLDGAGNPTALMAEDRYCPDKFWSGGVSTYYEIEILMSGNYTLLDGGTPVVIEQPKNLKLDTTNFTTANSGIPSDDIGKTYTLFFEGFGNLFNIPGGVFNTCTGEFLGEYFYGTWDEQCHRWASKFTIPEGSIVVDEAPDPDVSYFVKALKGDEFLKVLNAGEVAALPARDWSFIEPETETKLTTLLGSESLLIDMGPNGSADNKIGQVPTTLLNDGNPSVQMGKVLVQP